MEPIETKRIGKYEIDIYYDEHAESPLEWDSLGTMLCFHRKYSLGHDNLTYLETDYTSWEELEQDIISKENVHTILPLYLYDHSGITISTKPFYDHYYSVRDSGQIGYIFAPKKKVKELGIKEDKVEQTLLAEVDTYDQYIRGDIYGFIISEVTTDEEGNEIKEEVDSCWIFYGYDSCVQETEYIVNELTKNDLYVEQTANP